MQQRLVDHTRTLVLSARLFVLATTLLLSLGSVSLASAADSASITEAYEEIPHRRTEYNAELSTLPRDHSRYLEQLFTLTDRAVIQRVGTLRWFKSAGTSGKTVSSYTSRIRTILSEFDFLARPRELSEIRDLIVRAIESQHTYFKNSHKEMQNGGAFVVRGKEDKLIGSSHKDLQKAAQLLLQMYPKESAHNRQAFVDHLSALDFIQE